MEISELSSRLLRLLPGDKPMYEWETLRPARHLPPGLWLKRLGNTGSVLDFIQPHFVHPLEALAVEAGCYGKLEQDAAGQPVTPTWEQFSTLNEARGSFAACCRIWGGALGLKVDQAMLRFHLLTPWNTGEDRSLTETGVATSRLALWTTLGFTAIDVDAAYAEARSNSNPPVYRPSFWSDYTDAL